MWAYLGADGRFAPSKCGFGNRHAVFASVPVPRVLAAMAIRVEHGLLRGVSSAAVALREGKERT